MNCEDCRYWVRDVFRPGADEGDCTIELPQYIHVPKPYGKTPVTLGSDGCDLGKPHIEYRKVEL